jgi:hypothetical protein
VEALTLFHGSSIINDNHIKRLIVIGDSTLIIKLMLRASSPSDGKHIITIKRIRKGVVRFGIVEYFYILRMLNKKVDYLANMVILLGCNILRKRGDTFFPIP